MYVCIYIYIYIYRERERDLDIDTGINIIYNTADGKYPFHHCPRGFREEDSRRESSVACRKPEPQSHGQPAMWAEVRGCSTFLATEVPEAILNVPMEHLKQREASSTLVDIVYIYIYIYICIYIYI